MAAATLKPVHLPGRGRFRHARQSLDEHAVSTRASGTRRSGRRGLPGHQSPFGRLAQRLATGDLSRLDALGTMGRPQASRTSRWILNTGSDFWTLRSCAKVSTNADKASALL